MFTPKAVLKHTHSRGSAFTLTATKPREAFGLRAIYRRFGLPKRQPSSRESSACDAAAQPRVAHFRIRLNPAEIFDFLQLCS